MLIWWVELHRILGSLEGVKCMLRPHGGVDMRQIWPIFDPFPSLSLSLSRARAHTHAHTHTCAHMRTHKHMHTLSRTVAQTIHRKFQELLVNTAEVHYLDTWQAL